MSKDRIKKGAYIDPEHEKFLEETSKNFSLFVRNKIEEEMQKEGYGQEQE